VLLSWSSGKDSGFALRELRRDPQVQVAGLLTTVNSNHRRVAMHGVREERLEAQAASLGLPLRKVDLPWPCPNEVYEERMDTALRSAREDGVSGVAFGDLFLEDVRRYREDRLAGTGMELLFPLWGRDTGELAGEMIRSGLRAVLTTVDPRRCPPEFCGRGYDYALLRELPASVDPCGENGEFHTLVRDAPGFGKPIPLRPGPIVERDGFVFADFVRA